MVTYIQPQLILRGVIGFVALARRTFQRQGQPQWLIPTYRFHHVVVLDAIRLRSYASSTLAKKCQPRSYVRLEAYSFFGVIRGGIGLTRRLGAELQHTECLMSE